MSGSLGNLVVSLSADIARFQSDMGRAAQTANEAANRMANSVDRATANIKSGLVDMAGAAAAAFAAFKVGEAVKDSAMLAARVETLGVVMTAVGNNAGYSGSEMAKFADQVKAMGITTQESRNSIIKMAGAQMDLSKASQLARVAQDAAVIGGINSSEAYGRMIQGIRSGELEVLKTIGINVQFEEGYKKTAAALGKTTAELTAAEKMTSRMNEVLAYGSNIAGVYEASMSTAGKQISSMSRYTEELKLQIGEAFRPTLVVLIEEANRALKDMNTSMSHGKGDVQSFGQDLKSFTSGALNTLKEDLSRVTPLIAEVKGGLYLLGTVAALPGRVAGDGFYNEMAGRSKAYFEQANAIRAIADAQKAVKAAGGDDPSDVMRLKMAKDAAEARRISLSAEAAAAKDRADKERQRKTEEDAAAKAAIAHYNAGVGVYNGFIDDLTRNDPTLDAHSKKIAEIQSRVAAAIAEYPEFAADIRDVGKDMLDQAEAAKTLAVELVNLKTANADLEESIKGMGTDFTGMASGLSVKPLQLGQIGGTMGYAPGTKIGITGGMPKFSLTGADATNGLMGNETSGVIATKDAEHKELLKMQQSFQKEMTALQMQAGVEAIDLLQQQFTDNKALSLAFIVAKKGMAIAQIMMNTEMAASALTAAAAEKSLTMPWGSSAFLAEAQAQAAAIRAMSYVSIGMVVASGFAEGANAISGKRAKGGPVRAGETYLVGEQGPELMTAAADGYVTPNHALGGSTYAPVFQIDARGSNMSRAEMEAIATRATDRGKSEILNSMNRGGEFAIASGRIKR